MNRGRHHHERHSNGQCTVSNTGSGAAFAKRPRALAIRRHVAAAETTPAGPLHSVEVTVPAKTNLTLHVGPAHEEWGGRHALDTIYCAIGVNDVVTATAKTPGSGFSLELSGEHLGDLASSGSDMRRNHAVLRCCDSPGPRGGSRTWRCMWTSTFPSVPDWAADPRRGGDIARREHLVGTALAD